MKAVIYCRISKDRTGAGLGVERQQKDCEQLAEALGWDVVGVYTDNDISAYSGKPRPGYQAMLDAVRGGEANAIIAWHNDRLHRRPAELEEFISICEAHHVSVRTVQSGELDLETPAGRMTARIVGAVSRHEIDHAKQRMIAAHAQGAEKGHAHGRIPWGYQAVEDPVTGRIINRVPHPENAPLIQEAVKRILAGETPYSVAKSFNDRGVPTPQGGARWHTGLVSAMVQSPTYAGNRSHKGVVTKGAWEPIVAIEDHEATVALLSSRGRIMHRGTEPKYLLSGIALCGVCKSVVHRNKSRERDAYTCSANTRCVSRNLAKVDALVEKAIITHCQTLSILDIEGDTSNERAEAQAELARLQDSLAEYEAMAAKLEISPTSFRNISEELRRKIQDAQRRGTPTYTIPELADLVGPNAAENWAALKDDMVTKRKVVRALMRIEIKRSTRGSRNFRPEDIYVEPIRL